MPISDAELVAAVPTLSYFSLQTRTKIGNMVEPWVRLLGKEKVLGALKEAFDEFLTAFNWATEPDDDRKGIADFLDKDSRLMVDDLRKTLSKAKDFGQHPDDKAEAEKDAKLEKEAKEQALKEAAERERLAEQEREEQRKKLQRTRERELQKSDEKLTRLYSSFDADAKRQQDDLKAFLKMKFPGLFQGPFKDGSEALEGLLMDYVKAAPTRSNFILESAKNAIKKFAAARDNDFKSMTVDDHYNLLKAIRESLKGVDLEKLPRRQFRLDEL